MKLLKSDNDILELAREIEGIFTVTINKKRINIKAKIKVNSYKFTSIYTQNIHGIDVEYDRNFQTILVFLKEKPAFEKKIKINLLKSVKRYIRQHGFAQKISSALNMPVSNNTGKSIYVTEVYKNAHILYNLYSGNGKYYDRIVSYISDSKYSHAFIEETATKENVINKVKKVICKTRKKVDNLEKKLTPNELDVINRFKKKGGEVFLVSCFRDGTDLYIVYKMFKKDIIDFECSVRKYSNQIVVNKLLLYNANISVLDDLIKTITKSIGSYKIIIKSPVKQSVNSILQGNS